MYQIVCLNVGSKYADFYVERLYNMLSRHVHGSFELTCFTDRKREISADIRQVDCSSWGYEGWFNKIKLFDVDEMPATEFYYFDMTLIIRSNLGKLFEFAQRSKADLVAVKDWNYDVLNSCVMRITRSEMSQVIWETFRDREYGEEKFAGDQNFIDAVIKRKKLESTVDYFPEELIVAYRSLLKLHRKDPVAAKEQLEQSAIVKFHGNPRMTDILSPLSFFKRITLRYPLWAIKDWMFLNNVVRENWR